MVADLI